MKRFGCAALMSLVAVAWGGEPKPNAALQSRIDKQEDVIGIVHWGLNTYTDREWGYGNEDPAMLNPDRFDANQIVGACKAAGMCGLVVVAKHHDGFCLWPTKTTAHNISKSPFRGGKGDYVKEMMLACRMAGLKFGVYCSPWDRNNVDYGTAKYVETYHQQLRELLDGNYGAIFEVWFDGANGGDGWYGGAKEKRKIPPGYYRFDEVFRFVRLKQKWACIFCSEIDDAEYHWPYNEKGIVDPTKSATRNGKFAMWEADFPLRKGWFHHDKERDTVRSGEFLMRIYLRTVGNGGTMNIGIAPDQHGVLPPEDVKALKRFGEIRKEFFKSSISKVGTIPFYVTRDRNGIKKIRFENEGAIGTRTYYVDRELALQVLQAKGPSSETDTARWMQDAAKELKKGKRK